MKQYRLTCEFRDTEYMARVFCEYLKLNLTPYMKRAGLVPHVTPWDSLDGEEHKYIVWYYEK